MEDQNCHIMTMEITQRCVHEILWFCLLYFHQIVLLSMWHWTIEHLSPCYNFRLTLSLPCNSTFKPRFHQWHIIKYKYRCTLPSMTYNQVQISMCICGGNRRCWVEQYGLNFTGLICTLGKQNRLTNVCMPRSHHLARINFYTKVLEKILDDKIFHKLCCLDFHNLYISLYIFGQTWKCFDSSRFLEWLMIWNGGSNI